MSNFASCIFHDTGKCNTYRKASENTAVKLKFLKNDLKNHAQYLSVDLSSHNERSLIMNRARVAKDNYDDDSEICPYHRYSLGTNWQPSTLCHSPHHTGKTHVKGVRVLSTASAKKLTLFERYRDKSFFFCLGNKVCLECLRKITNDLRDDEAVEVQEPSEELSDRKTKVAASQAIETKCHEWIDDSAETDAEYLVPTTLEEANNVLKLISKDSMAFTRQVTKTDISSLSSETVRKLKRSYDSAMSAASTFFCESLAPNQGQSLKQLFEQSSAKHSVPNEVVEAYENAPNNRWRCLILSLFSSALKPAQLKDIFDCSTRMINNSREISRQQKQFEIITKPEKITRNRLDTDRIRFFYSFLFNSGLYQDVAYGTTSLKFDSGDSALIPKLAKTALNTHILQIYERHCDMINYQEKLSRSTVFKLLGLFKTRKSQNLAGLDSFVVDGIAGFTTLKNLILKFNLKSEEEKSLLKLIELSQNYLKVEYKIHVTNPEDNCFTHCRIFALSDSTDKSLSGQCGHKKHSFSCEQCNILLALICRIETLLLEVPDSEEKEYMLHDFNNAVYDINEWMFHIVRGVQQDESKKVVLENLKYGGALLLSDFAQKILEILHREKQSDYYARGGKTLSTEVLFYIDENGELKKFTYFTAIDSCRQDMESILCIFENLLFQIQKDFPYITDLYTRSDNAGCYSGASALLGRYFVAKNLGFRLVRTDFNEPQRGKDQPDRETAVFKEYVRAWTNRGNDLINAKSIKTAFDSNPRSSVTSKCAVLDIDTENTEIKHLKLKNVTKYHSAEFADGEVRLWNYFDIGVGKTEKLPESFDFVSACKIDEPFDASLVQNKDYQPKISRPFSDDKVFFCSHSNCTATFDSEAELATHELSGQHLIKDLAKLSSMDQAKHIVLELLNGSRIQSAIENENARDFLNDSLDSTVHSDCKNCKRKRLFSLCGYAVRRRKPLAKITEKHRSFLRDLYERGERFKKKYTAEKALEVMTDAKDVDGSKLFKISELLSKGQIRSQFQTIGRKKRTNLLGEKKKKKTTGDRKMEIQSAATSAIQDEETEEDNEDDDALQKEYFDELEEEETNELISKVTDEALEEICEVENNPESAEEMDQD